MRTLLVALFSIVLWPFAGLSCLCGRLKFVITEAWWKCRLGKCGSPLWMGCAKVVSARNVEVGSACTFEDGVLLSSGRAGGGIKIGDGVHIRRGTTLYTGDGPKGSIAIGNGTMINYNCSLLGDGGITLGNNVLVSPGVVITSFQHGFSDLSKPIVEQAPKLAPVVIEDDVYIGSNAVLCPGVRIGRGAVVGAGAIVTRDIEGASVAFGVPAQVQKKRG